MNPLLLLADPVQTETLPVTQIIIEYVVYAAIIVVGILILLLIRRKMRLPRHADLRKMLTDFTALLAAFSKTAASLPRLKYLKNISNLLYRLDKLIYTADRMAEKERDGELESISLLLGQARAEIAAYKFGARGADDKEGLAVAQQKMAESIALLDRILDRDAQLRKNRS